MNSRRVRLTGHTLLVALLVGLAVVASVTGHVDQPQDWLVVGAILAPALKTLVDEIRRLAQHREQARRAREPLEEGLVGHFQQKGRGSEGEEDTDFFTGREAALNVLAHWLLDGTDSRTRVVTGQPGAGKSALLGRLWMLSDRRTRRNIVRNEGELPKSLACLEGRIGVAVQARNKAAWDIAIEIAIAFGLQERLPALIVKGLRDDKRTRYVILVDSIDEAAEPKRLVDDLLIPLGNVPNVRLLVGTREPYVRRIQAEADIVVVDLDTAEFTAQEDVIRYLYRRLSTIDLAPAIAESVAQVVARSVHNNYLIAQIVTRLLRAAPEQLRTGSWRWQPEFAETVGMAMDKDLSRLGDQERVIRPLLVALAFAEGAGLPLHDGVWTGITKAVSSKESLDPSDALSNHVARAYVVRGVEDGRDVYRLYHEALAAHLRKDAPPDAARRITLRLLALVPEGTDGGRDWRSAPRYLRRHFAAHASGAQMLDRFLTEPTYLLAAAPSGLLPYLETVGAGPAGQVAGALRLSSEALQFDPKNLLAQLHARLAYSTSSQIHALLDQLAGQAGQAWLRLQSKSLRTVDGPSPAGFLAIPDYAYDSFANYFTMCSTPEGRFLAVIQGRRRGRAVLSLWDLSRQGPPEVYERRDDFPVTSLAACSMNARPIVVCGEFMFLQVWGYGGGPSGLSLNTNFYCMAADVAAVDGKLILASGNGDGTVQVWDLTSQCIFTVDTTGSVAPPEPSKPRQFEGHIGGLRSVAVGSVDGLPVIVSGDSQGLVRMFEFMGDAQGRTLIPSDDHDGDGNHFKAHVVAVGNIDGVPIVVSAYEHYLRILELGEGGRSVVVSNDVRPSVVEIGTLAGFPVVICGGSSGLRVWHARTGRSLAAFVGDAGVAACSLIASGQFLACATTDGVTHVLTLEGAA